MLGYSALEFGVGFVVVPLAAAVGMIVAQAAVEKVGLRAIASTGMALLSAGPLLLPGRALKAPQERVEPAPATAAAD